MDRLSGSFPNLAPNKQDVVDGGVLGSPQGSNPNLASTDSLSMGSGPKTPVTSPTVSESSKKVNPRLTLICSNDKKRYQKS